MKSNQFSFELSRDSRLYPIALYTPLEKFALSADELRALIRMGKTCLEQLKPEERKAA